MCSFGQVGMVPDLLRRRLGTILRLVCGDAHSLRRNRASFLGRTDLLTHCKDNAIQLSGICVVEISFGEPSVWEYT